MTPHRDLDRWLRANPAAVDRAVAGALFVVAALVPFVVGLFPHPAAFLLVTSLQTLPLAWRRSRPALAAALVAAGSLGQLAVVDTYLPSQVAVPLVVHALATHGRRRESFAGLGLGLAGAVLATARYGTVGGSATAQSLALSFLGLSLIVVVAWTLGDLARTRRLALRALEDRARRLEVERQQERDLAAADERSHIAREMHDIVAHSLSVIITQADGARYASARDPEVARHTLATISEAGRGSLREMRRLLGVLRGDEAASTRPLPTLADLPDLLESTRRTGLDVRATLGGRPRRPLPAGAELTAYRAVQEGLTNVVKHAGPAARATVALNWTGAGLEASVTDDGRGAAADGPRGRAAGRPGAYDGGPPSAHAGGQGLRGMAERVALYDGAASSGPLAGGGFAARIFIPYTED
ncbi:sensor histidine kinase [Arthrobacter halodurans]|uniref:histidine kinase n=1 Tax=Arthrobacter halodurans TaxID=516699 RepID=A0ABV4UM18_9MICC